jgi:hypothetical protein
MGSEGFAVISGKVKEEYLADLQKISKTAESRYSKYTTAHHEWINSVESSDYRSSLDKVRTSPDIINKIKQRFPSCKIKNVTEADEIYWAVSPKNAGGSDRALVDCHYDSPFAWIPTGGVIYYRVIIACNENNTVTTVFPSEDTRVKMTTRDFHGLDYNQDWHCVEGTIPDGKYRVLLKMHYIITPYGSEEWESWVRWINVKWTVLSRETMRMSAKPENIWEVFVATLVTLSRVLFNHFYTIAFIFILIIMGIYRKVLYQKVSKLIISKKGKR